MCQVDTLQAQPSLALEEGALVSLLMELSSGAAAVGTDGGDEGNAAAGNTAKTDDTGKKAGGVLRRLALRSSNKPTSYLERPVATWTEDDVARWLAAMDLDFYGPVFEAGRINGSMLQAVDSEAGFERLGVTNYRDGLTMWQSLRAIKDRETGSAAGGSGRGDQSSSQAQSSDATASSTPEALERWTPKDVETWLQRIGKGQWCAALRSAKATGHTLATINNGGGFEKLGVTSYQECMDLFKALQQLKRGHSSSTTSETANGKGSASGSSKLENNRFTAVDVHMLQVPRVSDLGLALDRIHQAVAIRVSVTYMPTDEAQRAALDAQEATLVLQDTSQRAMLARTKRMLIDLLRQMPERESLEAVISRPPSERAEQSHRAFEVRMSTSQHMSETARTRAVSVVGASLSQLQSLLKTNLRKLVEAGVLSADDDYQALKNALALDIRRHALLRRDRRKELKRLATMRSQLDAKAKELQARIAVYQQYCSQVEGGAVATGTGGLTPAAVQSPAGTAPPRPSSKPGKAGLPPAPPSSSSKPARHSSSSMPAAASPFKGGTRKWSGAKLKQRQVLVSVATIPGLLPLKDMVFEVSSYSVGEYRLSANIRRGEYDRMTFTADDLKQKLAAGATTAELVPHCTFDIPVLREYLVKKFAETSTED